MATETRKPRRTVRVQTVSRVLLVILISIGTAAGVAIWNDRQLALEVQAEREAVMAHMITPDNPPSPESFYPQQVVERQGVVRGVQILTREQADQKLNDAELVLAVSVGDEARAYPLNVLTGPTREIFNDRVGGRSLAATW